MPQTRQTRGRPPAKGRNKGRPSSRQRGRQSGRSGRGGSVVVKLPHVGARTAMRTSRRIPHRRPVEEPEMESDTEAAEEGENDSLPPVAAYEEHQAELDSQTEDEMREAMELHGLTGIDPADSGGGRRSRSLAARKNYINRRFLYVGAESEGHNRHRGRQPRDSPHRSHQRRGRRPRRQPRSEDIDEMKMHDDVMEEDITVEGVVDGDDMEQLSPLRIVDMDNRRRRGRRRRSENIDDDLQGVPSTAHLNKRSRRSSGRRRGDESDLLEVEDVGMTFPTPENMESARRRRRGRGRPAKTRLSDEIDDDLVGHHDMLESVSPPGGPVPVHPSPGMGDYEDEDDDDDEMKAAEGVAAYDAAAEFGDDEGLLSQSDDSPVLVGRHGVRGGRPGYEMEDEDDYDDIEEASALVYGRPPRSAPGLSPGSRALGHHPSHGHASSPPHGPLGKKYGRRHKLGPSRRAVPIGVPGSASHHLMDAETAGGPQGHHQMVMHGSHHGHHGHGPVPGGAVVPPGSGRESVKSEDDMDDEFMFEEGAAFTADNDPPVGGEGTATGLSHTTHHGPMTGLPGPWSAGRRKTPLKPLTAGGPRTSDLDIFMGLEEEGIMPIGAPRGEHSYSAMAQKGGSGHATGLQDLDYYPPAAPQQYVEPPPDSHVPPPINKPTQHRHGRNSSRRPSILPRRTALPRNRQPSLCLDPPVTSASENIPATGERNGSNTQIDLPAVVTTESESTAPITSAETSDGDLSTAVTASTQAGTTSVTTSASETEPSPAIAKSASAKLFQQRTKRLAEKEAAALGTTTGGLPVEAIPPEGAVLVAGIPAFRVAPGGLSILRRIPTTGTAAQVAVTSASTTGAHNMKSVLGAANQQQAVVPASGAQLSTGAATPAGDAWLKSKNMRIVVFRNEKGEQKTVVMPEDHNVRRLVSTTPQGQIVTPGALGQPILVQQPQQQQQQPSLHQQQYVTIQQPVLQPQQTQQNQPIRYVKIINPGNMQQNQPIIGGLLKK